MSRLCMTGSKIVVRWTWISTQNLCLLGCHKLAPSYINPICVIQQVGPVTFHLQLTLICWILPAFHISMLKPVWYTVAPLCSSDGPPLSLLLDDGEAYAIHVLLDSRCRLGKLQYIVDWKGYDLEEWACMLATDVLDLDLISAFHQDHPDKPAV